MRKMTGLVLAVAVLGAAGYFGVAYDRDKAAQYRLTELVRIASESSRPTSRQTGDATRTSIIAAEGPHSSIATLTAATGAIAGQPSASPEVIAPPLPRPFATARPKGEADRLELTKSIQLELRRVGCFEGDTDGVWNSATRRGMQNFTDRVNASLPTNEPDYILLTLLQGHAAKACGKDCPSGQSLSYDGRCYPRAIVATQAREAPARAQIDRSRATSATAPAVVGGEQRTRAVEDVRQREASIEQQRAEAEKLRASRIEIEQLKGSATEAARHKQVELDQLRAAAKAEIEQQRLARLEADRAAKAQAADEMRRRKQAELEAKQSAQAEAQRARAAALEVASRARPAANASVAASRPADAGATVPTEAVVASATGDRLSNALASETKPDRTSATSSATVTTAAVGVASTTAASAGQWVERTASTKAEATKLPSVKNGAKKKFAVVSEDDDARPAKRVKVRTEPSPRVVRWTPSPAPWPLVPRYIQRYSPPFLLGGPYFVPRPVTASRTGRTSLQSAASRGSAFQYLTRQAP